MNTQVMIASRQEMTIVAYSIHRSNNPVYGAVQAVKVNELVKALRRGVVHGYFTKKDGSVREFWGTTITSLAAKKTQHEIGYASRIRKGVVPFIDCETGQWRSLRIGSLISFNI